MGRVCGFCGMFWNGGLGFSNYEHDEKFCGRACFKEWKMDMSNYKLAECEITAIEGSLPALGQYVAQSGIGAKAFNDCSKDEILALTANVIKIFRVQLAETLDGDTPF